MTENRGGPQAPEAAGWRAIDTAPEDGPPYMIYRPEPEDGVDADLLFAEYGVMVASPEWATTQGVKSGFTHWCPIPPIPVEMRWPLRGELPKK